MLLHANFGFVLVIVDIRSSLQINIGRFIPGQKAIKRGQNNYLQDVHETLLIM